MSALPAASEPLAATVIPRHRPRARTCRRRRQRRRRSSARAAGARTRSEPSRTQHDHNLLRPCARSRRPARQAPGQDAAVASLRGRAELARNLDKLRVNAPSGIRLAAGEQSVAAGGALEQRRAHLRAARVARQTNTMIAIGARTPRRRDSISALPHHERNNEAPNTPGCRRIRSTSRADLRKDGRRATAPLSGAHTGAG